MQKVVSKKGKRQVSGIASGERGVNTTMVCCCNAAGLYIPPMIIFKRKRFAPELARGAPVGSLIEISDTGYINSELFVKWLKHFHAIVQSSQKKPLVLLLDGHSTHSKNLEALDFARQHHIHLLQLPSHTTHRLQPLDVGFFKPMQNYYVQEQDTWLRAHVGQPITVYNVSELLSQAYGKAATVGIAEGAFRGAGIWPVNRNRFGDHLFAPSTATLNEDESIGDDDTSKSPSRSTNQKARSDTIPNLTPDAEQSAKSTKPSCSNVEDMNSSSSSQTTSHSRRILGEITPEKLDKSLNELAPVPGTSKIIQKRRNKSTASAVILTSTPYKQELQEKKRKAPKENKKKTKRVKKEAVAKATVNLFSETQKKTEEKPKLRLNNTSPNSTDSDDDPDEKQGDDELCLYCNDSYLNSKPNEGWARCQNCGKWAHEACGGIEENEDFICDICITTI